MKVWKKGVETNIRNIRKLSEVQSDVLYMLTKEFETIKGIAIRRKTSKAAVYKIVAKLKKKGLLTHSFTKGINLIKKTRGTNPQNLKNCIRLHGQQFQIKIIKDSEFYRKLIKRKNQIILDGNTIDLHKHIIIVSCNELREFIADTPNKAKTLSSIYWNELFFKLENKFKVIIIKGENTSIKQFNGHFSELDNELAKYCNEKKAKIQIKGETDGLVWLLADKSWDVNELETVHPREAQLDMQEAVQPFFNSLRINRGYTPQMVLNLLAELIQDRKYYAAHFKTHVKAVELLGSGVFKLRNQVKRLDNKLSQKKLSDYK